MLKCQLSFCCSAFPKSCFSLGQIEELSLSDSCLKEIPKEIGGNPPLPPCLLLFFHLYMGFSKK